MAYRRPLGEKIFDVANHALLLLLAVTFVYPLLIIIAVSITPESLIIREGYRLIPREISLDAYLLIFQTNSRILSAAFISVLVTVAGTILNLILTTFLAYGVTFKDLPFRKGIMIYILITMFFNGGLLPTFVVMNAIGVYDTIWVMILTLGFNPFYMLLVRNYFYTIPSSLLESARMDGAQETRILFSILLPLCAPILAAITLFVAVAYWNDWTTPLFYTANRNLENLQLLLNRMLYRFEDAIAGGALKDLASQLRVDVPREGIKMATVVLATTPIVLTYPFLQKYFIKGIIIGAIKE